MSTGTHSSTPNPDRDLSDNCVSNTLVNSTTRNLSGSVGECAVLDVGTD